MSSALWFESMDAGSSDGGGGDGGEPFGVWTAVGWPVADGEVVFQPENTEFKFFHLDAAGQDITATLAAAVGKLLVAADAGGRIALRIVGTEEGSQVGAYGPIEETGTVWTDGLTYTFTIEA